MSTVGKSAEQMRKTLGKHSDSRDEYGGANAYQKRAYPLLFAKVSPRIKSNREGVGAAEAIYKGPLQILACFFAQ